MTGTTDYTPDVWGAPKSINEKDLTLPSGQRCRVKELVMEEVLELDLIDLMDTFTGQVIDAPKNKDGSKDETTSFLEFLKNKQKREKLIKTIDSVIPLCVVAPKVEPDPKPGRVKREGRVYVSMIGLNDKLAIFSEVFSGFGEAAKFRKEQAPDMGALAESESVQHDTE